MLICYRIPIVCEYNGIFEKSIYLECEKCPTFDELLNLLLDKHFEEVKMSEEHPEWMPYSFEFIKAVKSMQMFHHHRGIDEFPRVDGELYLSSATFFHEELELQSICCHIIKPIKI